MEIGAKLGADGGAEFSVPQAVLRADVLAALHAEREEREDAESDPDSPPTPDQWVEYSYGTPGTGMIMTSMMNPQN